MKRCVICRRPIPRHAHTNQTVCGRAKCHRERHTRYVRDYIAKHGRKTKAGPACRWCGVLTHGGEYCGITCRRQHERYERHARRGDYAIRDPDPVVRVAALADQLNREEG